MIRHCSLFKFKPGAPLDVIVTEFRRLPDEVSTIRSAKIGRNIGFHKENYDISANIEFDSIEGYREYCEDPVHLKFVADYLMPNLETRVAIQFDLD